MHRNWQNLTLEDRKHQAVVQRITQTPAEQVRPLLQIVRQEDQEMSFQCGIHT